MTGPDSTPDFSWLNENDEAAEAASNPQEDSEDSQNAESEEAENASIEETPPAVAEVTEDSPVSSDVPSDPTDDDSQNSSALEEDGESDSGTEIGENSSVFDDAEEEPDRESDSNSPTMMMPGRQLPDDAAEDLQSEFDDDDKTMVLETEDSSPQTAEDFANAKSNEDSKSVNEDSEKSDATTTGEEPSIDQATVPSTYSLVQNAEQTKVEDKPVKQTPGSQKKSGSKTSDVTASEKPNIKFLLLASYASAVTILALILMMRGGQSANSGNLESLPDVAPEPADELSYVPVKLTLPSGHRLKLGEKQRFGNIEVEPLKVVKEPLEFTHYSGNSDLTRPATAPVYKLWLKFTNVSKTQKIAPLDGVLMLRWVRNSEKQREYANYYIFADGTEDDADIIETYRHSITSDWDMQNQQLGRVLEPGESYETYIPSMEGLSTELPQNANWRLQFRKGYSPSGNGVTTIIDVAFRREEVDSSS